MTARPTLAGMELHKAHGTGNDFVVLPDPGGVVDLDEATVVALCDRRFGIGADGVLRLAPSADAHVFMDYRNGGDGGVVEMCGNGVRVVAAHLVEHGWTDDEQLRIDTRDGVKTATVHRGVGGRVHAVTVDMGPPRFDDAAVAYVGGTSADGMRTIETPAGPMNVLTVSMGNPHAVVLTADPATAPVETAGPAIERSASFANGANVEFVAVRDRDRLELRVWERGVGETLACGTGVCGAVAALTADGVLEPGVTVHVEVPGGLLQVRWDGGADDPVMLTGPVEQVGRIEPDARWLARIGLTEHDGRPAPPAAPATSEASTP